MNLMNNQEYEERPLFVVFGQFHPCNITVWEVEVEVPSSDGSRIVVYNNNNIIIIYFIDFFYIQIVELQNLPL